MSTFDANTFLQTSYTDATDTHLIPIPEGEFLAQVSKVAARTIKAKDGGDDRIVMDVVWEILDSGVKDTTGLDKPSCRQTIWIDLSPSGNIDMSKGRNVGLGKLRDALGQNKSGQPWNPNMLLHNTAYVKVENSLDPKDAENVFSNVTRVSAQAPA